MKKPWKLLDPEDVMEDIQLEPKSLQRDIDVLIAVAEAASIKFDKETSLEPDKAVVECRGRNLPVVNAVAEAASIRVKFGEETRLELGTADLPVNASRKDVIDCLKKKRECGGRFDMNVVDQLPGKNPEDEVSEKSSKLVTLEGLSREESLRRERLLKKPMTYEEEEAKREHYRMMKKRSGSKIPSKPEKIGIINRSSLKKRRDFGGRSDHMKIVDQLQALDISMPVKKMEEKVASDKSKFDEALSTSREELLRRERLLKAKRRPELPNPPPDIPVEVMRRIEEMGGTRVQLVIQKALQRTDCASQQNRLSIPLNAVISKDFLDESEKRYLEGKSADTGTYNAIEVVLIQPDNLETVDILFRKWSMRKPNGAAASHLYVLNKPWFDVAQSNRLEANQLIQLWSFRVNGNLCLALVRLPETDPS